MRIIATDELEVFGKFSWPIVEVFLLLVRRCAALAVVLAEEARERGGLVSRIKEV